MCDNSGMYRSKSTAAALAASCLWFILSAPAGADSPTSPKFGTWGFDVSGMDRSASPGADFYKYANGDWEQRTAIPQDRSRFGTFDLLAELSEERVHEILEDAAAGRLHDPDAAKIGAAYRSFMDEARVNAVDFKPLARQLATIRSLKDRRGAAALMGRQNTEDYPAIFDLFISQDAKAPDRYAVELNAGGLGLPDRDYYLKPAFAAKKAAYQQYAQQLLGMIGWQDPAGSAQAIVDFESQLAAAAWTRAESRDRDKTYNPVTLAQLQALGPEFAWDAFLKPSALPRVERFIVLTNTAFPKYAQVFAATPLPTLQAWFAFRLADDAAPYLSQRFVDARFEFRSRTLAGQPEQRARWKRAVAFVNSVLGEAVGRVYVARYFPPQAKASIDALVANLQIALKARIEKLDWMTPETKARALDKLSKFTVKVGYPAKWRNYGAYAVGADLLSNRRGADAFEWHRELVRLNRPVDRMEWGMTPQTVNAYYRYANNEVVFPAAILQPPFFDPAADAAVNYGGIGATIGHEISHGFDDQGRKSDGAGVLTDWWTEQDASKFKAQAARLGSQFSAFEPFPGLHVNGDLTMGENIGDLGGVSLALDAYHASLHGQAAPVLDGFTGDQRFFLSFAQIWRSKQRDDALRNQVVSDPHSPDRYRVNGTLRNVEGWYGAFDIKPGEPLYIAPEDRVHIW
jgi:putative endopeptidase